MLAPSPLPEPAASAGIAPKPERAGRYGFIDEEGVHACTRNELIRRCQKLTWPHAVWTPQLPDLLLPAAVPFLRDAISSALVAYERNIPARVVGCLAAAAVVLGVVGVVDPVLGIVTGVCLAFGAGALLFARRVRIQELERRLDPRVVERETEAARHDYLVASRSGPRRPATFTWCLVYLLVAVGVLQLVSGGAGHSIEAAGLVKAEVRGGAWWRLLTAPLLHAGFVHLWFNFVALSALGAFVEAHTRRVHVLVIFVCSALAGSVASLLLLPATTSVGASGGVLGLLGFLLAISYRGTTPLPAGARRTLWGVILLNAVIGMVGFRFIDNAGHAGGFVAGALLGLVLPAHAEPEEEAEPRWSVAEVIGWAGVLGIAGFLVLRLFTGA
jgi:membrane associated rhomboid family serine protease